MATVTVNDQSLTAIAEAIRGKLDVETTYKPSEMAAAIGSIETGASLTSADEGKVVVEDDGEYVLASQTSQTITQNGTYDTTTISQVIASVSGGGSVFTILEFTKNLAGVPTATINNQALQGTTDQTDGRIIRYVVPSSGTLTLTVGTYTRSVQISDYLKPVFVTARMNYADIVDLSSGAFEFHWYYRSFRNVATSGKFVVAATINSGFKTVALYTLVDYGAVGNVITGDYVAKVTFTITDPSDGTSVTVYGYGGFDGSFNNDIEIKVSRDDVTLFDETTDNLQFFAPYRAEEGEPYYDQSDEAKENFIYLLRATL